MISRVYDAETSTLKAKYFGRLTADELQEHLRAIGDSDEYARPLYILVDGFEAEVDFPMDARSERL